MLLTMVSTLSLSAQENNRLNHIGEEFLPSMALIKTDIENGKITEINQETIDNYSKAISLKTEMNVELASHIYELKKGGPIKFEAFITEAEGISPESKDFILKIALPKTGMTKKNYQVHYTNLVNEIEKSEVSSAEKDMLLAYNSIAFNLKMNSVAEVNNFSGDSNGCYVQGLDGEYNHEPAGCVALATGIGFVAGFQLCGLWCGVGGALVFGVIAAVNIC